MDYKTQMDKKNTAMDFFKFYSERMEELEIRHNIPDDLSKLLKDKRNFGVEKYGEYSFQSTFENALSSPSEEHLREELIDAINYALHSIYKAKIMLIDTKRMESFLSILVSLYSDSVQVFPDL